MAILGIHHAGLVVPSLDHALEFYSGVLGFETVQTGHIEPTSCTEKITQLEKPRAMRNTVRGGWGYLDIWEFENPVYQDHQFFWAPVNKYGIRHLSLMVDNAMDTYHYLKEHMVFHGEPVQHSVEGSDNDSWSAYGRDPFGNIIELWQLGEKDPQPFSPGPLPAAGSPANYPDSVVKNGILGMHHVALVVPDLEKAIDFYTDVMGFERVQYGPIEPSPYAEIHTQLEKPRAEGFIFKAGWGHLEIWEYKHPIHAHSQDKDRPCNKYGFAHFTVMVDDCLAEYERLKDRVLFHCEPVAHSPAGDANQAYRAWGRDPFGNIIEFWQIGATDPQPFTPEVSPHG